jgi:ferredoxin-thioredoxin reductase catalytic subunit
MDYDNINPSYYNKGKVTCEQAIESAVIGKDPDEAVWTAMAIKYLWRYESKGGLEDVTKAAWYVDRLRRALTEKANTYQLVGTENGVGLQSPWHTLMVPHEGDMFNPNDSAREHLLSALLQSGGYCPCQPKKDRDTMCPCKNYRMDGKCICGLYVKVPQSVVDNSDKNEVVGDESDTEKGTEQ